MNHNIWWMLLGMKYDMLWNAENIRNLKKGLDK